MLDLWTCNKTAPTEWELASMSNINVSSLVGYAKIGACTSACFILLKATSHFSSHLNLTFFFVRRISGAIISEQSCINLL